jgi:hypothetical protein
MKICYFGQLDLSKPSGIVKKFLRQICYWKNAGINIEAYIISPSSFICDEVAQSGIKVNLFQRNNWLSLFTQPIIAFLKIKKAQPDIVYLRFSKYLVGMRHLSKKVKVIVEINTLLANEHLVKSHFLVYLYSKISEKLLLRSCVGAVFLTPEICEQYHGNIPNMLILGDGIEIDSMPQNIETEKHEKPRLVFMASNNMIWQGLDKVLYLAHIYPCWDFIIIGPTPDEQAFAPKFLPNVNYYGFLDSESYRKILFSCDVAIGTLALHRINMNESTPLKVREYLSIGLPIIIGYHDPDFTEDCDFILKLPNTEINISANLEKIEKFVESWQGKKVEKERIRHIDTNQKEATRLKFIQSIAESN